MITVKTKKVKLSEIHVNPNNPRQITDTAMEKLKKSLRDFPEMLNIREIVVDETMTVLGGNMRLLALHVAGAKECAAKVVTGLTDEQKREFVIKDNGIWGQWDFDLLANEWDDLPLAEWGVNLPEDWLVTPNIDPDPENDSEKTDEKKSIICPECGHKFTILSEKGD